MVVRNDREAEGGALRQESGEGGLFEEEQFERKLAGPYE